MQKISELTSTANTSGEFSEGSAAAGVEATQIKAGWLNTIQRELLAVLAAAGVTPDPAKDDQLAASIAKLVTAGTPDATEVKRGVAQIASDADFVGGVDDSKFATVKKIATWFSTVMKQATETSFGWAKIATQALVDAGTDDSATVTAKKLRYGFSFSFGTNGYIVFPTWLKGLVFQWGTATAPSSGGTATSILVGYPLAFPNSCYYVSGVPKGPANSSAGGTPACGVSGYTSKTSVTLTLDTLGFTTFNQSLPVGWFAIGN